MKRIVVVLLIWLVLLHCLAPLGWAKPAKKRRAGASKKVKTIFAGATPSGDTRWVADAAGSIYSDVDVSFLKFDRPPVFFSTVTVDYKKGALFLDGADDIAAKRAFSSEGAALVNVTGAYSPRKVTVNGFRVRLRNRPEAGKNLTALTARTGGWRVRWVAITQEHPILQTLQSQAGDVRPTSLASVASINIMRAVLNEEEEIVKALYGREYELPLSQQPKPKPKPKPKQENATENEQDAKKADQESDTDTDETNEENEQSDNQEDEEQDDATTTTTPQEDEEM